MSGFIRFLGSAFLFIWVATMFLGVDLKGFFPGEYRVYSEELLDNKWLLLILGIVLSIAGSLTKVKDVIKKKKRDVNVRYIDNNEYTEHDISSHENTSFRSSAHTSSYKDSSHNSSSNHSFRSSSYQQAEKDAEFTVEDKLHTKKNYAKDQYRYKGREFANRQRGKQKEIAMKVDWTPLASGGSNFKTSLLKQMNSSRLEVHKSIGGLLFSGLFAVVGMGVMAFGTYSIIKDDGLSLTVLAPILFGGLFAAAGIGMFFYPRPRVFDRRYGWFWAGNKSLAREQDFIKLKKSARLSEIAAIQIIDERCSSKNGSYSSWEINLVSDDGQRVNVMDHGNKASITEDARKLGKFLGVPVWENS